MRVGYARVSTDDQHLDLQLDALNQAGCNKVFHDRVSGAKASRPGLSRAFDALREGDVLVVWRLDRLGRSLRHLIDLVSDLDEQNVGLCSLQESIDTSTNGGKLIFHLFGSLAEFERNLIRERTQAGLKAARARGKKGGRQKALDKSKRELAVRLYFERNHTVKEICRLMGVSKPTLYKYVAEIGEVCSPEDIADSEKSSQISIAIAGNPSESN